MLASAKIFRNLASALTILGLDAGALLEKSGLRAEDLEQPNGEDRRVPVALLDDFWTQAVASTGDQTLGVRIGALARIEAYGVLGYVARTSATLGDALLKTARYLKLWNEATSLSLLVDGHSALLWYRPLSPELRHPAVGDLILTMLLVLSRQLTGQHLVPTEARFAHAPPAAPAVYRDVFGCAPSFDTLEYALVFPPDVLTLPITTHDSGRSEELVQQAGELVDALPAGPSLAGRVRKLLAAELHGGNPMIENVAAQLRIHPRTLTRRLRDEGTSHRELLDSLRRELAERYVSASELNVTEVAFLLGFSDASAFNKAFKRWSGVAPLAFRQRARSRRR